MNKKLSISFFIFILLSIIFVIYGCTKSEEPQPETPYVNNFGIYRLKDTIADISSIINIGLKYYPRQDKPFISDEMIDYYDWSSHFVYVKKRPDIFKALTNWYTEHLWINKPFIFVAESASCYMGYFGEGYFNQRYGAIPGIDPAQFMLAPQDVFEIGYKTHHIQKDIRNDERIRNAIIKSGKLREGLRVTLDSLKIYSADTSTVEYYITIENRDNEVFFAYDPEKLGSDYFHKLNDGILLLNLKDSIEYSGKFKNKSIPFNVSDINIKYYTRLAPVESIKRKVILKGYEPIPYGNYYCQFKYYVPTQSIEKEQRIVSGGTIWIGNTLSNILDITYDSKNNCKINNKNVVIN